MSAETTIMDKFLEFLRYFFTKDLPETVTPEMLKERLYLVKFLFEQFKRVYIHYYEDNKVPIFDFTMYGEPGGKCLYEYVKSSDLETSNNYDLNSFAEKLREIIKEWDESLVKVFDEDDDFNIVQSWQGIKNSKTIN